MEEMKVMIELPIPIILCASDVLLSYIILRFSNPLASCNDPISGKPVTLFVFLKNKNETI